MKEKKRILFRYVLFHSFRVVGFELSVFSAIDKVSVNLRVRLAESLRFFQSHHHEGGSQGIGGHAVLGDYGRGQDAVLYRIARSRVDGMGIFLAVFVVIVAVVAGSCQA